MLPGKLVLDFSGFHCPCNGKAVGCIWETKVVKMTEVVVNAAVRGRRAKRDVVQVKRLGVREETAGEKKPTTYW